MTITNQKYVILKNGNAPFQSIIAQCGLATPGSTQCVSIKAVIDTGATCTMVDARVLQFLNPPIIGFKKMRDAGGGVKPRPQCKADLYIGHFKISNITVTESNLDAEEQALIGMDIIDELHVCQDEATKEYIAAISFKQP